MGLNWDYPGTKPFYTRCHPPTIMIATIWAKMGQKSQNAADQNATNKSYFGNAQCSENETRKSYQYWSENQGPLIAKNERFNCQKTGLKTAKNKPAPGSSPSNLQNNPLMPINTLEATYGAFEEFVPRDLPYEKESHIALKRLIGPYSELIDGRFCVNHAHQNALERPNSLRHNGTKFHVPTATAVRHPYTKSECSNSVFKTKTPSESIKIPRSSTKHGKNHRITHYERPEGHNIDRERETVEKQGLEHKISSMYQLPQIGTMERSSICQLPRQLGTMERSSMCQLPQKLGTPEQRVSVRAAFERQPAKTHPRKTQPKYVRHNKTEFCVPASEARHNGTKFHVSAASAARHYPERRFRASRNGSTR